MNPQTTNDGRIKVGDRVRRLTSHSDPDANMPAGYEFVVSRIGASGFTVYQADADYGHNPNNLEVVPLTHTDIKPGDRVKITYEFIVGSDPLLSGGILGKDLDGEHVYIPRDRTGMTLEVITPNTTTVMRALKPGTVFKFRQGFHGWTYTRLTDDRILIVDDSGTFAPRIVPIEGGGWSEVHHTVEEVR